MPESVRLRDPNFEAMRMAFAHQRQKAQLSFDALRDLSGLSRMTLINLEHGVTKGSLETWHRICQVLGVSLSDMVAHLDDPPDSSRKVVTRKKKPSDKSATPRGK